MDTMQMAVGRVVVTSPRTTTAKRTLPSISTNTATQVTSTHLSGESSCIKSLRCAATLQKLRPLALYLLDSKLTVKLTDEVEALVLHLRPLLLADLTQVMCNLQSNLLFKPSHLQLIFVPPPPTPHIGGDRAR